ncbi:MAG: STN domain-containing protein [Bacteroidota bacterium]
MKFTAILLFSACMTASATGDAQGITLNEKAANPEKVFNSIKQQTGFTFWYKLDVIEGAKKIDITVKDATITEVLNICITGQKFTYEIIGNTIVIKEKPAIQKSEAIIVNKPPPPIGIKGRVTNENGEGIAANIIVKEHKTEPPVIPRVILN